MMRQRYRWGCLLFVVGAMGFSLGACQRGQHESTSAPSGASPSASTAPQNAPDPATYPVASNAPPPGNTRSFAALMRELKPQERVDVREWYHRIGGPSMDSATPAQVAWMQARHYPMPADIARAASMSESELKAAAGTGDTTARILYVARLLDEYNRLYGSINGPSDPVRYRDPNRFRLLDQINVMMPQILASGSPYAGYLYAARDRLTNPGDKVSNAGSRLAGLVWASKLGDTRADRLLNAPVVQAVNASAGTTAMGLMLTRATLVTGDVSSFAMPVVPIPASNL